MPTGTEAASALSSDMVSHLQSPQPVLVTTLGASTEWPVNNLITWVLAKDPQTIRLVADAGGRVLENIRNDGRILLTVMADGACHSIEGEAAVVNEELEGLSLRLGMAEVKVRAIRDVMFHGGRLTAAPRYDVTYDLQTRERLDSQVFEAMRRH